MVKWAPKVQAVATGAAVLLASAPAFANTTGGAASQDVLAMLNSFKDQMPGLESFILVFAFIVGLTLVANSLFKFAKMSSGQSQETPGQAITIFVSGILLVSLASVVEMGEATLGIDSQNQSQSILAYVQAQNGIDYKNAVEAVLLILKPFGFMAVFRGILLFKDASERRGDASVGKGLTHVVGGVLLANAGWTVCTIANTFGSKICT